MNFEMSGALPPSAPTCCFFQAPSLMAPLLKHKEWVLGASVACVALGYAAYRVLYATEVEEELKFASPGNSHADAPSGAVQAPQHKSTDGVWDAESSDDGEDADEEDEEETFAPFPMPQGGVMGMDMDPHALMQQMEGMEMTRGDDMGMYERMLMSLVHGATGAGPGGFGGHRLYGPPRTRTKLAVRARRGHAPHAITRYRLRRSKEHNVG